MADERVYLVRVDVRSTVWLQVRAQDADAAEGMLHDEDEAVLDMFAPRYVGTDELPDGIAQVGYTDEEVEAVLVRSLGPSDEVDPSLVAPQGSKA